MPGENVLLPQEARRRFWQLSCNSEANREISTRKLENCGFGHSCWISYRRKIYLSSLKFRAKSRGFFVTQLYSSCAKEQEHWTGKVSTLTLKIKQTVL
ncbi:unnamed protein product [Caretta caretta]